ncbi:MAG: PD-(D/E)XK nuclease family protein [Cyclobacteriaceae bacterium]
MSGSFLGDVATRLLEHVDELANYQVVFPNRRAGLFFQKELALKAKRALWSPKVLSMEEFVYQYTDLQLADPLNLIFELYNSFTKVQQSEEGFDRFYFWGDMLLKDFEDVDQSLVSPKQIFQGIKSQKELDETFYFLDEEDRQAIQSFWASFLPESKPGQQQFLRTWKILLPVYEDFIAKIIQKRWGYQGLIYRRVVESIQNKEFQPKPDKVIFAGFNALTPAEEEIFKYFVGEAGAKVYWDCDDYYLADHGQEAGNYLRQYQKDPILGKTFDERFASSFQTEKKMEAIGVPLQVAQAKNAGLYLKDLINQFPDRGEKTVVVLPQEQMLFPTLSSMPAEIGALNVTMGYPLKDTPLYSLLESLMQVQQSARQAHDLKTLYYYKPLLEVLGHPYLQQLGSGAIADLTARIKKENVIQVPEEEIREKQDPVLAVVFGEVPTGKSMATYLDKVVKLLYEQLQSGFELEREYFFHFHKVLTRLDEILSFQTSEVSMDTFSKLFRQVARAVKIPFSGEPLKGLQIMGVLETRNLDFENVIILSMNEGSFPDTAQKGSFIPFNIRRAFGLPTFQQQDAIYSYLFYRLIQRAKNVRFYYNTQAEFGQSGEISRFVRQLEIESAHEVQHDTVTQPIKPRSAKEIEILKDDQVMAQLVKYTGEGGRAFTPSAINTYLSCTLRFYYRYVARLFEEDEVQEQLDAAMFGNILHKTMELLYEDAITKRKPALVEPADFFKLKSSVDEAIRIAFRNYYHVKKGGRFEIEGRNIVMAALVRKYALKVLDHDEVHAPFEVVVLEGDEKQGYKLQLDVEANDQTYDVNIKGIIDRIDQKDGQVRIIDYKSGADNRGVGTLASLFDPKDRQRNKAAFQLFFYAMLYQHKHGEDLPIEPGLFNIREMFLEGFSTQLSWKGGGTLSDMRTYLPEYKNQLTGLLAEIYDREVPFIQTDDLRTCGYCPYRNICQR